METADLLNELDALPRELVRFADGRLVVTATMLSEFLDCRRKARLRYEDELVPLREDAETIRFGRLFHQLVALGLSGGGVVGDEVRAAWANLCELTMADRRLAIVAGETALAYFARWRVDLGKTVPESLFWLEPRNPDTRRPSRRFVLAGRVDELVIDRPEIVERKTSGQAIDAGYLERIWSDWQTGLYALGTGAEKIVYEIFQRCQLKMRDGEEEEFRGRVRAWLEEPGRFHREEVYLTESRRAEIDRQLWETASLYADARRRGEWTANPSHCFHWGRPCPYYRFCSSGQSEHVLKNLYARAPRHQELTEGSGGLRDL